MAWRGSLSRSIAAGAGAARSSSLRSPARIPRSGVPPIASLRSTRRPFPFSSPRVLGCADSLLPMHSVVAARLTSHLSISARACCELSQVNEMGLGFDREKWKRWVTARRRSNNMMRRARIELLERAESKDREERFSETVHPGELSANFGCAEHKDVEDLSSYIPWRIKRVLGPVLFDRVRLSDGRTSFSISLAVKRNTFG